jgi:hypothetical protein
MNTYKFSFHGRQTGAIGIFYNISEEYKANSFEEACSMLYKDYEHISLSSASCGGKKYDKDEFRQAVYTNTPIPNYKRTTPRK